MTSPTPTQLSLIPAQPLAPEDLQAILVSLADLPADNQLPGDPPSPSFTESVATFGVVQPIILQHGPHGYIVAAGRRRIKASRAAGLTSIPAVIYPAEVEASVLALVENSQRSRNLASDFLALRELIAGGANLQEVATATGMPIQTIRARLRLSALIPALFAAFTTGRVSASVADAASSLSPALQQGLAEILEEKGKLTLRDVDDARRVKKEAAAAQLTSFEALFQTPASTFIAPSEALLAKMREALTLLEEGYSRKAAEVLRSAIGDTTP